MMESSYDYIVIGSGFGGSVAALRLSEKGYKVLVVEKGKWFRNANDFPKSNWNLRKWFWLPAVGMRGIFKMTFYRHVVALSGVGVGGGSLVYANTLAVPERPFFNTGNWYGLLNWEEELKPYYDIGARMLGATPHPYMSRNDQVMEQLSKSEAGTTFEKTKVAVYFGEEGVTVDDPYFNGQGPNRTGCNQCGGCMVGCRYNAKNTLDKNYLHLAQLLGAKIVAEREVTYVKPQNEDGSSGYEVTMQNSFGWFKKTSKVHTQGIIFAGGVTGTVPLLLKLKSGALSGLSEQVGCGIRTNSESLIGVTTFDKSKDFSEGIAIGSIVQVDENRHMEPVKYPAGSGLFRLLMAPMISGKGVLIRLLKMMKEIILHPYDYFRVFFTDDWSKRTMILLYMESIDSTLKMVKSAFGFSNTQKESGHPPTAFNPKAQHLAQKVEKIINGKAMVLNTEAIFGIPTTAHILGGACMGKDAHSGVIDQNNKVFNYANMYVCDGSMISANPGVNPSLSILAISERAMSQIKPKNILKG